MGELKYRFQFYKQLQKNIPNIFAEARKIPAEIGVPKEILGKFGIGGGSFASGTLSDKVIEAMDVASRNVVGLDESVDQIRTIVKDVYGDEYDAAPIATCEAALWVSFDVLSSPPMMGRGDNYRSCYLAPYERHLHHQGGYGRPFPPKYKDICADRGVTPGEAGVAGKRLTNLETVVVPLVGARYDVHGIKHFACPNLLRVDPQASVERIAKAAERHSSKVAGFTSLGYDCPGYGYGIKDKDGTPVLQRLIGELAEEYDVPYVCDNARGLPFVGVDPRKNKSSVILYSMDKAAAAPTSGLILGRSDVMISIRKSLGMHGARKGTVSSYGKAAYVTCDPGKEAIAGQIVALETLRDEPETITKPVDDLHKIVKKEFSEIDPGIKEGISIYKSGNSANVEVNYADTWKEGKMGIPIFSIEDMYAGTNLLQEGMRQAGILPPVCYDGEIVINTRQGTTDGENTLIEERARYAIKALVKVLEIISKYAGVI